VWIIANRNDGRPSFKELETAGNKQCDRGAYPDTPSARERWNEREKENEICDGDDTNSGHKRLEGKRNARPGHGRFARRANGNEGGMWRENWLEVATRFCGVDDGLPGEMDGATLSKARHRAERLKALGNAIVPQVAVQIFRGLKMAELMESL